MDARLSDAVFSAPAAPTLGGPGPLAPVPAEPKPRTARVRVTSEVVGVRGMLGGYYRSLPPWIDDLTREYGPETYERMQLDETVSASVRTLCHGVLSDDLVLRPAVDDKKDPDFGAAKDALSFCERATWQQTGGLDQWLLAMLKGAVGGGNRVSETVYRPEESGRDAGKWVLDRLKVKPRRSIAFAVDSCNNLTGFLGLPPGGASWGGLAWGTTFDPADPPENFRPRDKFCALAWDPHDEDPRGSSLLRCVYEPWWAKLQAAREWLAYLAQFGSPGLVGTTAPGADSSAPTDAWGNAVDGPVLTPEQDMANKVMEHRNGGVHILPAGATLDVLQTSNAGDAFLKKVDSCDRAIAQGINLAMRAVMQSRFGSRADAEQGQDVAGLQTRYMKRWLARMVTEDLLRPLVRINYGPDAARRLCPYASLSPVEHQDLGPSLVAVSGAWKNGLIKNSQLPWVYEQFGMPPATEEELAAPPPGSVPPGGPDSGGPDPLAQALLKQGPPPGGAAPFAFNPGQSRGQPENRGQFGPGGGGAGPLHPVLSAGKPQTVAQLAKATGLSKGEVADRLTALHREGRLELGVSRGNATYKLKGPPAVPAPLPAPVPAAGREQREEEAVLAEIRSLLPAHPDGMVPISRVRKAVAAKYGTAAAGPALDDVLFRLRYNDRVRLIVASDLSALSPEDRAGAIQGMGELYHSVSLPEIAAPFAWDESRHPRGQPENAGEFGPGGGGTAAAEKPPGRKPRVDVGLTDREEAAIAKIVKTSLKIKGGLTGEQLAALGGAPEDGQATVRPGEDKKSLKILVSNDFSAIRHLRRLGSGELVMENEYIKVKDSAQGKGLGSDVFSRQVDAARALGVGSIRCHAAKQGGFNGYYTWPRLGYDMDFEELEDQNDKGLADKARAAFPGAESVLQLMATPEGRAWWKANGTDLHRARFDLADGSNSMTVFNAYREERARG